VISGPRTILHNRDPDANMLSIQCHKDAIFLLTMNFMIWICHYFKNAKSFYRDFNMEAQHLAFRIFFICNIYFFSRTFSASQDWLFQDRRISLSKQNVPPKCSRILHRSQCEVFVRFSTFTFPLNIDWI